MTFGDILYGIFGGTAGAVATIQTAAINKGLSDAGYNDKVTVTEMVKANDEAQKKERRKKWLKIMIVVGIVLFVVFYVKRKFFK